MDTATIARSAGAARAAIGIALLAAPGPAGRRWLGDVSERPGAQVAIAGVGARDLVLGLGTVWAAGGRKRDLRSWVIGSGVADLVDVGSMLRARRSLTTASLVGTVALAGGSAALCAWLQAELG